VTSSLPVTTVHETYINTCIWCNKSVSFEWTFTFVPGFLYLFKYFHFWKAPSVLSLRGPEFDDRLHGGTNDKLPPIRQESWVLRQNSKWDFVYLCWKTSLSNFHRASNQTYRSRYNSLDDEPPFSRPHTPRWVKMYHFLTKVQSFNQNLKSPIFSIFD